MAAPNRFARLLSATATVEPNTVPAPGLPVHCSGPTFGVIGSCRREVKGALSCEQPNSAGQFQPSTPSLHRQAGRRLASPARESGLNRAARYAIFDAETSEH